MKHITLFIIIVLWSIPFITEAQTCGIKIFIDEFNTDGSIPTEWTEFNTNGQVTVDAGRLKFDYTTDQPGAYRTFTPVSEKVTLSFTEESTRNWVKCRLDVLSSNNKYLTSIMFGNDGTGTVQYATSLDASNIPISFTGALIDDAYQKNYEYNFALTIDFETNTFDFYENGIIRGEDIPFIESAGDIAKVSITQISMYSNEGRFFFDNIALADPGADRSALSIGISNAESLVSSAIISPLFGYDSETYTTFTSVIEESKTTFDNCDATQETIDAAANILETAITEFENAFKNETVLTLYSGYDFSGTERQYTCGYYNGSLDDFEDIPVSFKLAKGYMATFAQDVDGKGYSKVYIAQDNALEINLPEELQQSISFMRVSPWFEKQKKGSCGKGLDVHEALGSEWYYAWGMTNGYSTAEREFVPMSWSGGDSFSGLNATKTAGQNMAFNHHLAFNEPDLEEQSNMTVEKALEVYPNLFASGLRLGSPAVSHSGLDWINEFMDGCVEKDYRVDFIAIHDYVRRTPKGYYDRYKALHDKYNVPIWVTEYNYGNPGMGSPVITDEVALAKLQGINYMMDTCSFIERYSMFYFQPSAGQLSIFETRTPIVFNIIGEYYRDHESPSPSYSQEIYEQGSNIGTAFDTPSATDANIRVYPNPITNGKLYLTFPESVPEEFTLHIYDVTGKELLVEPNVMQLDVVDLKNGFYILRIQSSEYDVVQKIIIHNTL